jgi:DNA-binding LacI/PurR family transcriptional regulator
MPSLRPTLRTLAARLEVSPMTVSLALRGSPKISRETRERVRAVAEETGYRPDPVVNKLMQHLRVRRSRKLQAVLCGLMDVWPEPLAQRHRYTQRVLTGIRERAAELGYVFDCLTLKDRTQARRVERILRNRGVEGLVLLPRVRPTDMDGWLDWTRFSVLSVTSSITAPAVHSVVPHHFDNTLLACQMLARRGSRSIGLVISREWDRRVRHRWTGAVLWQNSYGGTRSVPPYLGESPGLQDDGPGLRAWMEQHAPEVIVTDEVSLDTVQRIRRQLPARRRPVIVRLAHDGSRSEAGIDQRGEMIGRTALDALAGMIVHGDRGLPALPNMTCVPGVWVEGSQA